MKWKITTDKIMVATIVLLLLSIATVITISIYESKQVDNTAKMMAHTNEVLVHTESLLSYIKDNESGSRGYVLTGQKAFADQVERSKKNAEAELHLLRLLTADNPSQQKMIDSLSLHVNYRIAFSDQNILTYDRQGSGAALQIVRSGKGRLISEQVRRAVDTIRATENKLLQERKEENTKKARTLTGVLSSAVIGILLLLGVFVQKIRREYLEKRKAALQLLKLNEALEERVQQRTNELSKSKQVLSETFERITDAFVALDSNWCYTYMNKKAGEIFNRVPDEMIGRHIWTEFPEGVGQPFYEAYYQAMETQQYMYLEEFYPPYNRWFENHIYPSPGGLSIFFRDITEKKKAEEELKASEEKRRLIMNSALDAIISIDDSGVVKSWNPQAEKIFGWPEKEITGKLLTDTIIPEKHREGHKKGMANYFKTGEGPVLNKLVEISAVNNSGNEFPVELTVIPIFHQGKTSFTAFIRDITERKKAEEKIEKVNRLYFFISQVNQMIVRTTDKETLFKEACRIAVELGKFTMAWIGLVDETTQKVVPVVHAGKDEAYLSEIKPISINEVAEGMGPTGRAIRDGKYHICNDIENDPQMIPWKEAALGRGYRSSMALPIMKFGKVIGAFSFYAPAKDFFDESEIALLEEATGDVSFALEVFEKESMRKNAEQAVMESERRYQTLAEVSPVGIFHTDEKGYTTYVNPRWCQISGLSYEDAMGNGWFKAVHEEDKERLRKGWEETTQKKELSFSEYRFVRPNSSIAWVIGQAIPERDSEGRIVGYVGTITEITERKKVEKEMEQASEKLRQLTAHLLNVREEERKRIGREIHDELGQQLTAIKMDVAWIDKKTAPENEAFKTKLKNVITLLDGGNQSIRRILNELRPVILDDYGLLEALKWQGQQFTANTGIPVTFKTTETQLKIAEEIATCVFRVFQEALTNITRYAKATRVVVSLDIDDENILLNIEDDGKGFDPELTNTKKSFGILGMKERVGSLNGNFDLIAAPGKGTKIKMSLPLKHQKV